jgi:DNA-binding beta-propeller fold protein YncE
LLQNNNVNGGEFMKNLSMEAAVLLCLLAVATQGHATTYAYGDVFASIGAGKVVWLSNTLGYKDTLDTTISGSTTGSAFDKDGNFYVTAFSASRLSKFDNSGTLVTPDFATCDANSHCESIVFDATGNMYVGQADGTKDVLKFDSTGAFVDRYDVQTNRGSDWIDLAADQTTLYYTSEGLDVRTYDVGTDTQGPPFANFSGDTAFALRLLADGGLLVADGADIKRLDSTGAEVQTYDMASEDFWFALNLDPDGTSFWSGDMLTHVLARFDIDSGALLQSVDLDSYTEFRTFTFAGLSVYGEITQGCGGP